MRHLVVFWALLCHIRYAAVQAQAVVWKFPLKGQDIQANAKDTVLLDWTSTTSTTILRMWCTNGTDGVTQDLASSFQVDSTGPFKYILDTYAPGQKSFPLLCHAELAPGPLGAGVDGPAGLTWHSNPAEAAKTISQTRAPASVTVTVTPSFSNRLTATSTTASTTTSSSSQSTTTPPTSPPSTPQTTTSQTNPTNSSQPSPPSSSNNTGPIVGGVIGGITLISFIVIALLFLRKYRRDHAASSLNTSESSKRGFHLSNFYKKGGQQPGIVGGFEKPGDHGPYEVGGSGGVSELQGSGAWRGDDAIRYHPVELPDRSNYP